MKLHVANLSPRVDEDELKRLFGRYGEVASISLSRSRQLGRATGTAVVEMLPADAMAAARELNGRPFHNRHLYITPLEDRSGAKKS